MIKPLAQHLVALFICAVTAAGCSSSPGPDAMSSRSGQGQCTRCHAPGSAIDPLTTNGAGTFGKHVVHVSGLGLACETCHFHYTGLITHMNGTLDTVDPAVLIVYFDTASNPTGTWVNNAAGTCSSLSCHGYESVDWYGTGVPACTSCHSYQRGARRPVAGAGGDFRGNAAIVSNHVASTGDPARAQCLVCHDQSTHTAGTVRLKNADDGASIVYDPAAPASLEPFCLSCHDTDGALATSLSGTADPFNDGVTLGSGRNVAGNRIKGYWTGINNRHRTNGGLTCAGSGAATTGCHGNNGTINMHGSVSKGLLTQNLTLGLVSAVASTVPSYDYDYKLCFDCHAGYQAVSPQVVLGYKQGGNYDVTQVPLTSYSTPTATIQSLFRDQYNAILGTGTPFYNDMIPIPQAYAYLPLHNYHLLSVVTFPVSPDDPNYLSWKYRGDSAQAGRITCVSCHNVHGTNGVSARSTFDELGITSEVTGTDQYGTMAFDNYSDPTQPMMSYPMNCAVDCHYNAGPFPTYYWNSPANE